MSRVDPEHNRRIAGLLADMLAPLIADLPAEPPVVIQKPVYTEVDTALVKAAGQVAKAVDRLEQAKFSPGEIPARMALIRSAYALRTAWRNRPSKSVNLPKSKGFTHE